MCEKTLREWKFRGRGSTGESPPGMGKGEAEGSSWIPFGVPDICGKANSPGCPEARKAEGKFPWTRGKHH